MRKDLVRPYAPRLRWLGPLAVVAVVIGWALPASGLVMGGGGWVDAWGQGSVASAVQPGSTLACDPGHPCEKTAQGTGDSKTFFDAQGEIGQFNFQAVLTVDLPDATPNGSGLSCYPVSGTLSLSTGQGQGQGNDQATLVLDVQDRDCAVGASSSLTAIAGTYIVDSANSTGKYDTATGVGSFNWSADSSASPADVNFALTGNFHFATPAPQGPQRGGR